eukprot:CAMPEP_0114658510 /NCGR_PEP_ID=MMETSP0191-20121206/15906_1 /TAXON_ID=126664 /ORGANISM="Sorites sp." /LENGTH=321 /DNA_ID=CAMNT_0001880777 /DNA_START=13 /DNA_END=978 /DNA_ORIENTATION=-
MAEPGSTEAKATTNNEATNADPSTNNDESKNTEQKQSLSSKFKAFGASMKKGAKNLGDKFQERMTMEGLLKQARLSLQDFLNPQIDIEQQIPVKLLQKCAGIVLITQVKASFGIGGSYGTGIVMKKLDNDSWSVPCAVGTVSIQWGLNIGGQKADHVIILRDENAVKTFSSKGNLKFGGDAAVSVGKMGRNANIAAAANEQGYAAIVTYSRSKGAYIGIALEGSGLANRGDCNKKFYDPNGKDKDIKYNAETLWSGKYIMPKNDDYDIICKTLNDYIKQIAIDNQAKAQKKIEQESKSNDNNNNNDNNNDANPPVKPNETL